MSEYTPLDLPLYFNKYNKKIMIRDSNNIPIVTMLFSESSEKMATLFAEYIVTACNEHDQLKQDRAELVEAVNHSIKMFKLIEERYLNTTTNTLFEFDNLLKKLGEL